jgi:hypothetical protein
MAFRPESGFRKARHQLRRNREHAAVQEQLLIAVGAKLGGAIVAALLSMRHR